jgi:hypothetical protein
MRGFLIERARRLFSAAKRVVGRLRKIRTVPAPKAAVAPYVTRIISDAILFNEIPSPTEQEAKRTEFIVGRLLDFGYSDPVTDDFGNVAVVVPSLSGSAEHILLFSDIRNEDYSPLDSLARLEGDRVFAKGIAESSVGVATLLVMAEYLARNGIRYDMNVVLLFTSFDPAEREIQPLERFLQGWKGEFRFAVYVRGIFLGRVEELPMGTYKLSVTARTPEREVAPGEAAVSAISVLANIAFRLGGIKWDSQNTTFLNIARLEAGVGFGWHASQGVLELEIFSSDRNALELARNAVCATIDDISAQTHASVEVVVKAFFPAANADINAGLDRILREVQGRLKIKPVPTSIPDHTAFVKSLSIPALSIAITTGGKSFTEEYIDIRPVETGFRQILLFLEESTRAHGEALR